jgi:uncharacterized protein YfaS (alpha-2-macroglobulin family)
LLAIGKFIGSAGNSEERGIRFEYNVSGGNSVAVTSESPVSQVKVPVKEGVEGSVKIRNTSQKTLFVKLQLEGIPVTGDQSNTENNLGMTVRYLNMSEKEMDPAVIEQGTDFIAEVTIKHPGIRDDYREMALTQIFPSGWEIRNLRLEETESSKQPEIPRYQDIRDDRVYSYFDVLRGHQRTYRILLNAAYVGEYYLPSVYCEAMYDNTISSRKAGKWVKVVVPGKPSAMAK